MLSKMSDHKLADMQMILLGCFSPVRSTENFFNIIVSYI